MGRRRIGGLFLEGVVKKKYDFVSFLHGTFERRGGGLALLLRWFAAVVFQALNMFVSLGIKGLTSLSFFLICWFKLVFIKETMYIHDQR